MRMFTNALSQCTYCRPLYIVHRLKLTEQDTKKLQQLVKI